MPVSAGDQAGRTLQGIGLLVTAAACLAVLDTSAKSVGPFVPILVVVWFRYLFQAMAVTAIVLSTRGRSLWRTQYPRFQLLRNALLLTVSGLSFLGVQFLPGRLVPWSPAWRCR